MCKHKPKYNDYSVFVSVRRINRSDERTLICQYCQQELLLPKKKARISKVLNALLFPIYSIIIFPFILAFLSIKYHTWWLTFTVSVGVSLLLEMASLLWYYYLCATNSFILKSEKEPAAEPESNENETTD